MEMVEPCTEPHLKEYPFIMVLGELSTVLSNRDDETTQKENARKVSFFLERIRSIFSELEKLDGADLMPVMHTPIQGILTTMYELKDYLLLHSSKSRLYQLLHCESLNDHFKNFISGAAKQLMLLSKGLQHHVEVYNQITQLSYEMEQSQSKISDLEECILKALNEGLTFDSVDQTSGHALMLDIARVLGINIHDVSQFSSHIEVLKREIQDTQDLQIADVLDRLLRHVTTIGESILQPTHGQSEEEKVIPPFGTFICPLSKEIMKDPVVLETDRIYEQSEIEKWFKVCLEQGRQPTCPLTGQVLKSLQLKKDAGLQRTIEEWRERNFKARILRAKRKLQSNVSFEDFEKALEEVHRLSVESPINRHTIRTEGLIPFIVRPWWERSEDSHRVRNKALIALHSLVLNNKDNKLEVVEANSIKYAVKSLASNEEDEKQNAARFLLEVSSEPEISGKIGSQKGALLLLTGLESNVQNPALSHLAEQTLKQLEKDCSNVIPMAEAGRLKPLFKCLREGASDIQFQMVAHLAQMTLTSDDKQLAAKEAGLVLIKMLSNEVTVKEAALKALLMLSTVDENANLLIDYGVLPPVFEMISSIKLSAHHSSVVQMKEMAADLLANLVSKSGHWESSPADLEGNTLQSETVIHCFLGLMTRVGFRWKPRLLQVLYYIASSPQAAEDALKHIENGNGIALLILYMREPEIEAHLYALKLLGILSVKVGAKVAEELRRTDQFDHLKKLLNGSELEDQAAAACILAHIPLTETEVLRVLGIELLPWIVRKLGESGQSRRGGVNINLKESLLALLLQFCRCSNPNILEAIQQCKVMIIFREHLRLSERPSLQRLSADGLHILSEKSIILAKTHVNPSAASCGCLSFLKCLNRSETPAEATCPVHEMDCKGNMAFCLIEADAVRPLVDMLEDNDASVKLAALRTLSTLLNGPNLKGGVKELEKADGVQSIIQLFCSARRGEVQDRLLWMIERILRTEELCQKYSLDQALTRSVVQAFQTGSQATRNLAQTVLTNLDQLSGTASRIGGQKSPLRPIKS